MPRLSEGGAFDISAADADAAIRRIPYRQFPRAPHQRVVDTHQRLFFHLILPPAHGILCRAEIVKGKQVDFRMDRQFVDKLRRLDDILLGRNALYYQPANNNVGATLRLRKGTQLLHILKYYFIVHAGVFFMDTGVKDL